jgi:hypothetical protein
LPHASLPSGYSSVSFVIYFIVKVNVSLSSVNLIEPEEEVMETSNLDLVAQKHR